MQLPEAVKWRLFFFLISQKSQESTYAEVFLLIKFLSHTQHKTSWRWQL